jgi:hypothetical protein
VLTGGILAAWGLDKAILSLCAARICRLVLSAAVREEVEDNLLAKPAGGRASDVGRVLADYERLIADETGIDPLSGRVRCASRTPYDSSRGRRSSMAFQPWRGDRLCGLRHP